MSPIPFLISDNIMLIKTYKANTNISINVVLANKKNVHVAFNALSNGSSTLTTDNEELQNAIEKHYNFGKLFRLISVHGESAEKKSSAVGASSNDESVASASVAEANETAEEVAESAEEGAAEVAVRKVQVSDLAAAKDYLADKFGISRTLLRSKKSIEEQAAAHGIEFEIMS